MTPEEWLYTETTYGPAHNDYVCDLYLNLVERLETSFCFKPTLDPSQRFSRLANILFIHSHLFVPYR